MPIDRGSHPPFFARLPSPTGFCTLPRRAPQAGQIGGIHGLRLHGAGTRSAQRQGASDPRRVPGRRQPSSGAASAAIPTMPRSSICAPPSTPTGGHHGRRVPRPDARGAALAAPQRRRPRRRRLAARAQLHGDVGRLLGGDEFGRGAAAQPAVHARGDRRADQRGQGEDAVRAAAGRARRPVREGRRPARARAEPGAHRRAAARRARRLRRRDARRPTTTAIDERRRRRPRLASSRCCRPAAPPARPRSCRSPIATWCRRRALGSLLRPGSTLAIARSSSLPMFHVGGAFARQPAALGAGATMVIPTAGGFRNPGGGRELLAHRRGAAHHRRRAGADGARRGRRRSARRARTFPSCGSCGPAPRSARPRSSGGSSSVWPGDCVRRSMA